MYRLACVAVAAAAFFPDLALAQETQTPAPKPAREKKSCRSDIVTGSMMRQSTCHTKAEWADIDARNQRNADDSLSRGTAGHASPNGS